MLSRVEVICFATSYVVALVLEVSRLLFRSGVRGAVMLGFAGVGLLMHSAFLYYHALKTEDPPLSSPQDWFLLAAWVLVVVYLYLVYYHPRTAFGLFLLPLVLALVGTGALADPRPMARGPASTVWGIIHGVSFLVGTLSVFLGFVAGVMYFVQARRLKHKLPPGGGLRLPSLEWLQRANGRAIVISMLMLGAGVVSGMILNLIQDRSQTARLPWHDPVVLSTLLMFGWLVIAVLTGALYKPARQGRKVAYLTMVSFVFLVIALGVMWFLNTQHGGGDQGAEVRGQGSGARGHGSGVRDQESGARGQGSGVRNQESGGRGQGSGGRGERRKRRALGVQGWGLPGKVLLCCVGAVGPAHVGRTDVAIAGPRHWRDASATQPCHPAAPHLLLLTPGPWPLTPVPTPQPEVPHEDAGRRL